MTLVGLDDCGEEMNQEEADHNVADEVSDKVVHCVQIKTRTHVFFSVSLENVWMHKKIQDKFMMIHVSHRCKIKNFIATK